MVSSRVKGARVSSSARYAAISTIHAVVIGRLRLVINTDLIMILDLARLISITVTSASTVASRSV